MDMQIFSKRLRELREKLNLSQKEFVKGLSVTAPTISAYEKKVSNPSVTVIVEIAEKYNVSTDWLLGLSNKTMTENKITTTGDLLQTIVSLCVLQEPKSNIEIFPGDRYNDPYICIKWDYYEVTNAFISFFEGLKQISDLYFNKSIDDELLNLWIEKTINKFKDLDISDLVTIPSENPTVQEYDPDGLPF